VRWLPRVQYNLCCCWCSAAVVLVVHVVTL
jgi:hypothetical protein